MDILADATEVKSPGAGRLAPIMQEDIDDRVRWTRKEKSMAKKYGWALILAFVAVLMFLGKSHFHQGHFNLFLVGTIGMIFLVMLGFFWMRDRR